MDQEVLQDLYDRAKSKGYSKSIEEFQQLISSDNEVLNDNFEYVKSKGYAKDISDFSVLVGFGEKKNQVVTPSDVVEDVMESTTETEITPGSLDSSGQPPIEIPIVEEEEEIVFDETTPENKELLIKNQSNIDLLNSVGYIEANEGIESVISSEGLTNFDKERLESKEKSYRLKNNKTGEFEYKKESEINPDVLKAIKIYKTSKDNSYTPNYLDVQVDIKDFERDDVPDASKLDLLGINQEDYLKWDKVNTRQEGSVFKFMKNILLDDEYSDFEKEQRQYEKLQSYQATQLNGITNDLEKNQALQKLTSDSKQIKVLKKEEKELQKKFYDKVGVMSKSIDLFPKFKDATVDTELEKRKRLYYAVKEGGSSEASQGTIELLRTGGTAIVDFTTNVLGGVPGFLDQRLTTLGYDKKGFLAGLSDMFTDSSEHVDLAYGGVKRSGFMSGKPVTYRGQQYFVDKNGKVYDEETNILMDGIVPLSDIKEIQKRSKDVPDAETMWTGGSVVSGGVSTLVNLFGLIRTGGKVNNALGLKKYMKTGTAGKVAMGLTSFTSGVVDNVDDIRSQLIATGMSEKEAMNIAVNAGQAISTLDGVFSGLAGSNEKLLTGLTGIKNQIKNLAISKGKNFTAKEFKTKSFELIKENAKELFVEELPVLFSEKGINYLVNRSIGQNVLDSKITKENIIETAVMTIGATTTLGGRKLLSGNRRSDLVRTIAEDIGDLQGTLDVLVKEGSLTNKESSNAYTEIYSMQTAENLTKGTILVSENMETASDLLIQRQNLINSKEGLEGPGKQNIDNKIADVDAQLDALYARDKEQAKAIVDGEQDGEVKIEVTKEEALESLKSENEVRKKAGLPVVLESDENILKQQEQLLKEKQDAISKSSTEKQVLPDASTSKEEGGDSKVGLQQVGEGDTQQVTTDTKVEKGDTKTDQASDTTTETDTEQLDLSRTLKEPQKLPKTPKQTKNENGVITSGKVHLYHSTNGIENLNNILENGIDFEKQKAVGGLFFSKLGSPYRQGDSFVVIETDVENIPFNQRTEGQEVALGQLSDYKIVHSSKMSPKELETLSALEMILNRKTNGGIDGYNKSLENYKKRNKNSELIKYLESQPTSTEEGMSVNKERVDSIVDGIIKKTKNRSVKGEQTDPKKILNNALAYLQGSKLYQESTDIERENAVREINEKLGIKIKKPPTPAAAIKKAGKVLGLKIPPPAGSEKFTSTVKKEIKVFWKNWNKAFRESKYDQDTKRKALNEIINSLEKNGNLSKAKAKSLRDNVAKVNLNNAEKVQDVIDFAQRSMNKADYNSKVKKADDLKKSIRKNLKNKEAGLSDAAKEFLKINPSNVNDIDAYLKNAESIKEGLKPSAIGKSLDNKKTLKVSTPFNIDKVNEYTKNTILEQQERSFKLAKESFQNTTETKELSVDEIREALMNETSRERLLKEKKSFINTAIKKAFINTKINIKQAIKNGDIVLSKSEKKLISDFLNINVNSLSDSEKLSVLDSIINFELNQSTGGMDSIIKRIDGKNKMNFLAINKIVSSLRSSMLGRFWNKSISTLPNVFELMFGSQQKASKVMKAMGVTDVINGAAKAQRIANDIINDYAKVFKKKKMNSGVYFDEANDIERGVLGEIQRFTPGKEVEEFNDSKNLIKETYENLLKSKDINLKNKGEIIKEVYDRLVKDSNNISEVQSKADPANLEGVKYMTDVWASKYELLAETSLNIYNKNLGKDTNYIPRSIQSIQVESKTEGRDITKPLFNPDGTSSLYNKKTGVLEEATKPSKLQNNNKILNLGFDSQNSANLKSALTDIETAPYIQQIQGAIDSDSFTKVFPNDKSRDIIKQRVIDYVDSKRVGQRISEDDKKKLNILNKLATLGVVKVLGGVTQPLKQAVPLFNTMLNAGPINTSKGGKLVFNKEVNEAINNSGLPIANRGVQSSGDISGVDSKIKQAAKTKAGKFFNAMDSANKAVIDYTLVKPDVLTARASFIAYYLKAMDKKGVKSGDIDFTKPLDKEAAQYAQQQVDRQQNTSDSDLQGGLFTKKDLTTQIIRKTIFPFANFLLNQKTRMYSDINTLVKNPTALPGDKTAAVKSLSGLVTETLMFNAIGLGVTQMLSNMARSFSGEEEDPNLSSFKNKQKAIKNKDKEFQSRLAGRLGNMFADVFVPLPVLNDQALAGANVFLGIMQEGEDEPFKFFSNNKKDILDQLGVFGIAGKKAVILYEMIQTINTGKVTKEYFGKKSSKELSPESIDKIQSIAVVYGLHLMGLIPISEAGYLSERAYKNLSKMNLKEKKYNIQEDAIERLNERGIINPSDAAIKREKKKIRKENS